MESTLVKDMESGGKKAIGFLKQEKVLVIITVVLFLILLIGSSYLRVGNIPLLKDQTTGEYIPAALDPFYWLRIAETAIDNGGLPEYDSMRILPNHNVSFSREISPKAVIIIYNVLKIFDGDVSLGFADVIFPVIFFALGLIMFFFLILKITKSKTTALLASFFLAIIPSYLYRTTAGFSDHDVFGMFTFFLALLLYAISISKIEKKSDWKRTLLFGILTGLSTMFSVAAWGGVSKFIFLIIPFSFFIIWITKNHEMREKTRTKDHYIYYLFWIASSILFAPLFGYPFSSIISLFKTIQGFIVPLIFVFISLDYLIIKNKDKIFGKLIKKNLEKYRVAWSFGITLVALIIISFIFKNQIGFSISGIINSLIRPFGGGRVGETVAENAQPYLSDIIGQIGKTIFWLFVLGSVFVGIEFSKGINNKKDKIIFSLLWVVFVFGILFYRVSSDSMFNGDNLVSKIAFFGSIIIFAGYFIKVYFKDKMNVNNMDILIISWIFFMIIAGRSAVRLIFIFTPIICFMAAYGIVKLYEHAKKSKDDVIKMILYICFIAIIIFVIIASFSYIKSTKIQVSQIGPSANTQWQLAMNWVRTSTPEGSIFLHWWDYGYWVQYLGQRPTLADGGHFQGDFRTHMIGRYVLTTPEPATALSFMKANNVSYLLIDPTDIGKYPAFSKIGSDDSETDRYAWIPLLQSNPSQMQETSSGEIRIYNGGFSIDKDINFIQDGNPLFLPSEKTYLLGIIIEENNGQFKQPTAVYLYNNNQIRIPMRYIYYDGNLYDFKSGTETGIYIIPSVTQSGNSFNSDNKGAVMYLSEKTVNSLVSKLYLMGDPLGEYPGVGLAYSQDDPLKLYIDYQSGDILNEFFSFNGNLRGPIKIWEIHPEDMTNIIAREEFLNNSGSFAEYDNLIFTK